MEHEYTQMHREDEHVIATSPIPTAFGKQSRHLPNEIQTDWGADWGAPSAN
jgi:hypothetical protein